MRNIVIGVLVVGLVAAGIFKIIDQRKISELEEAGTALRLQVAATDVDFRRFISGAVRHEAVRDSLARVASTLRSELAAERYRQGEIAGELEVARTTVEIDTLTPQLRNLIVLEREMATSYRDERDIFEGLYINSQRALAQLQERHESLEALVWLVRDERDSALVLVSAWEKRLEFNFFRWFGAEVPQKLACAGGGAAAAAFYDGQVLVGAGIGLTVCLIKDALFH